MTLEDALETLQDLEHDLHLKRSAGRTIHEQLLWDIEDLEGRIADLTYEPPCREGNHPFCCDPTRP
jgi:hypothetical protein